jgi:hypothetical protein
MGVSRTNPPDRADPDAPCGGVSNWSRPSLPGAVTGSPRASTRRSYRTIITGVSSCQRSVQGEGPLVHYENGRRLELHLLNFLRYGRELVHRRRSQSRD